jgi:hypothetical protein
VSVSEGDVIGLACDLDQGKLSWSLNGDWGTSVCIDDWGKYGSTDLSKVLNSPASFVMFCSDSHDQNLGI